MTLHSLYVKHTGTYITYIECTTISPIREVLSTTPSNRNRQVTRTLSTVLFDICQSAVTLQVCQDR